MKKSTLKAIIKEEIEASLKEGVSVEAAQLHAMTNCGQDAAQNFIDDNGLDAKKLVDYVKQGMRTNPTLKYDVRDYISGGKGTVGGEKNLRDKFIKQFKLGLKEAANPELDRTVSQFVAGLAKKYSYQQSDAVMAIFEAMKRLGLIDKNVDYRAADGLTEANDDMQLFNTREDIIKALASEFGEKPNGFSNTPTALKFWTYNRLLHYYYKKKEEKRTGKRILPGGGSMELM